MILGVVAVLYLFGLGLVWRAAAHAGGARRGVWLVAFSPGYGAVLSLVIVVVSYWLLS